MLLTATSCGWADDTAGLDQVTMMHIPSGATSGNCKKLSGVRTLPCYPAIRLTESIGLSWPTPACGKTFMAD